ncbi:hypothetical protein CR513_06515, partial [Mucuna pruriens]
RRVHLDLDRLGSSLKDLGWSLFTIEVKGELVKFLQSNIDIFAWTSIVMSRIDPKFISHRLYTHYIKTLEDGLVTSLNSKVLIKKLEMLKKCKGDILTHDEQSFRATYKEDVKNNAFKYNDECDKIFEKFKTILSTPTIKYKTSRNFLYLRSPLVSSLSKNRLRGNY